MPRRPRRIVPGHVYHLISRFVDREWFIQTTAERQQYLRMLGHALGISDWRCLAYAVMSNHIHLASVAGEHSLASWVRRVHSPFADAMNQAHDRIGPMFVRGPKAYLVPPDKLAKVIAYIHNNPVRARVVSEPAHSDWTSHCAYAGVERPHRWLHVDEGLERTGIGASSFDSWVRDAAGDEDAGKPEEQIFDELDLEEAIDRDDELTVDADNLVQVAAELVGLSVDEARLSRRKQTPHVLLRHVVARCGDRLGLTGAAMARALGTSQQCVSKILTQSVVSADAKDLMARVLKKLGRAA